MNSFGDVLIGSRYALYCPDHKNYTELGDLVIFRDGSSANLSTGTLDNKSSNKEMVIVPLANGTNHFKFGNENQNPSKVSGVVTNIEIDYPGIVQIIQSDTETIVQENYRCFAAIDGDTMRITAAKITEFTYFHQVSGNLNFTSIGDSQQAGNKTPVLKIYAPTSISISGSCGTLFFTEVADIAVNASVLSGNKANSIVSTKIKKLDCPIVTSSIKIVTTSSLDIVNQLQCKTIFIDTTGSLVFYKPVHANSLTIKGTSTVSIETIYANTVDINRTSRVEIKNGIIKKLTMKTVSGIIVHLKSCDDISIESTSSKEVTVDQGETSVKVTKSTGRVEIKLDIANDVTVETTSQVQITANTYLKKPIVKTVSKVKIQ